MTSFGSRVVDHVESCDMTGVSHTQQTAIDGGLLSIAMDVSRAVSSTRFSINNKSSTATCQGIKGGLLVVGFSTYSPQR